MNAVLDDLPALVEKELEAANKQFPPFASWHEAYAVIKEELEETQVEASEANDSMTLLWQAIMHNRGWRMYSKFINKIHDSAIRCAAEAIQVAAMAEKALALEEKENN